MKLSDEGLRLIKSFEGYHTRLPNGDCAAYLCPANVPTIGWGCTEGVKLGMVWTEAQAEEGLLRELAKFEAGVTRLVTVEMNQNEYDALVSFSYNVGLGALGRSTLLKRLNKGDRMGAAQEFRKWTRGGGRVLRGLVARREREAALFLKPVEAPEEPSMPQQVSEVREITKTQAVVGTGLAVGGVASETAEPVVKTVKDTAGYLKTEYLDTATAIKGVAAQAGDLVGWFGSNIILTGACAACVAFFGFILPKIAEKRQWLRSSPSS